MCNDFRLLREIISESLTEWGLGGPGFKSPRPGHKINKKSRLGINRLAFFVVLRLFELFVPYFIPPIYLLLSLFLRFVIRHGLLCLNYTLSKSRAVLPRHVFGIMFCQPC